MKRFLGCGAVTIVIGVALLALLVWGVRVYNRIVRADVAVDAAWSQVDNAYKRRLDLIPNLVATVKGAADFERGTLESVVEARARATQLTVGPDIVDDPARLRQFQAAQGEITGALARLLAVVESYPQLRATQNFSELQTQLEGTENRIATERRRFNEAVAAYNAMIRVIPESLVARLLGMTEKAFFQAEAGAEKPPEVAF